MVYQLIFPLLVIGGLAHGLKMVAGADIAVPKANIYLLTFDLLSIVIILFNISLSVFNKKNDFISMLSVAILLGVVNGYFQLMFAFTSNRLANISINRYFLLIIILSIPQIFSSLGFSYLRFGIATDTSIRIANWMAAVISVGTFIALLILDIFYLRIPVMAALIGGLILVILILGIMQFVFVLFYMVRFKQYKITQK